MSSQFCLLYTGSLSCTFVGRHRYPYFCFSSLYISSLRASLSFKTISQDSLHYFYTFIFLQMFFFCDKSKTTKIQSTNVEHSGNKTINRKQWCCVSSFALLRVTILLIFCGFVRLSRCVLPFILFYFYLLFCFCICKIGNIVYIHCVTRFNVNPFWNSSNIQIYMYKSVHIFIQQFSISRNSLRHPYEFNVHFTGIVSIQTKFNKNQKTFFGLAQSFQSSCRLGLVQIQYNQMVFLSTLL